MAKMGKLIEEGMKAGWLLLVEGCLPTQRNRREGSPVTRQFDSDGRTFHRIQGSSRLLCPPAGGLEGGSY